MSEVKVTNIFITGGNRGIGLGLVKAMLEQFQPVHLFVTYRDESNSQELLNLAKVYINLHPLEFDVTDYAALPAIVEKVESVTDGAGLNLLINNSGVLLREFQGVRDVTRDDLVTNLEVNTIAPIMLTQAFLPLLEKAANENADQDGIERAVVVNVSSILSSLAGDFPGWPVLISYRISKAAQNMATKCIGMDLITSGITSIMIHPGWVKTEMGTDAAPMTVEDSAAAIMELLKGVTAESNGKFLNYDGTEIPW